jgi:hypothetical protein
MEENNGRNAMIRKYTLLYLAKWRFMLSIFCKGSFINNYLTQKKPRLLVGALNMINKRLFI